MVDKMVDRMNDELIDDLEDKDKKGTISVNGVPIIPQETDTLSFFDFNNYIKKINEENTDLDYEYVYEKIASPEYYESVIFEIDDTRWKNYWVSSNGDSTRVRSLPSVMAEEIGQVYRDTPALFLLEEAANMEDGLWLPIRIHNQDNDNFPTTGWIRNNTITYRPAIQVNVSELDNKASFKIQWSSAHQEQESMMKIINIALKSLQLNGAIVTQYDEP